jgi:hypothetical protein
MTEGPRLRRPIRIPAVRRLTNLLFWWRILVSKNPGECESCSKPTAAESWSEKAVRLAQKM